MRSEYALGVYYKPRANGCLRLCTYLDHGLLGLCFVVTDRTTSSTPSLFPFYSLLLTTFSFPPSGLNRCGDAWFVGCTKYLRTVGPVVSKSLKMITYFEKFTENSAFRALSQPSVCWAIQCKANVGTRTPTKIWLIPKKKDRCATFSRRELQRQEKYLHNSQTVRIRCLILREGNSSTG